MNIAQKKAFKNRIDSLKKGNKKLSEKLAVLKKEKQTIQSNLRTSQKLLNELPGPVILFQGQHIVFANEIAWRLLGYTEEELLSHKLMSLVHPKSSEYAGTFFKNLSTGKSIPDHFEIYVQKKNGEPLCCEVYWKKIRYQGRTAYLSNMVSLDRRKQEEKKYSQSQKIKAIARMASWLSRDFNKGFQVINDHCSQLLGMDSVEDKKVIRSLRRFEASMEIGDQVAKSLNCMTRLENNPSDISLFDPKMIVQDAVSIVSPLWEDNSKGQINIKTYLRTLSPVVGHPSEIRDAFVSMILNAIDAMPEGGEIYLTTEENAGFAWIYIQDCGTGISDEIKDKIFDPFFTTKGSRGLGLSLAHAIIRRHGGEIEVISQEGQGATFIVKLPLSNRPDVSTRAKQNKNKIKESRILMISADSIAADLLAQMLVGKGSKVVVVYSCGEGLRLLRRKKFDIVMADMAASELEMKTILQKIKQTKKDVPIVLLNSGDNGLRESEANLTIGRPFEMDRILSLVSKTIVSKAAPV